MSYPENEHVVNLEDEVEYADNPVQRTPAVLALDTSGSMRGRPINELQNGVHAMDQALKADERASMSVDLAITTFGHEGVGEYPFKNAQDFIPPILTAGGTTPLGPAGMKALDMVEQKKQKYREYGIAYTRPWLFIITDGAPNPGWQSFADRLNLEYEQKKVLPFLIGVQGANMEMLERIAPTSGPRPARLDGLRFVDLFEYISVSLSIAANSTPGAQLALPSPGWAHVSV